MGRLAAIQMLCSLLALGGCAAGDWATFYQGVEVGAYEPTDSVRVRLVEMDRLGPGGELGRRLGESRFTALYRAKPIDPQLRRFARRLGATDVLLGSAFAGRVTTRETQPIVTDSYSSITDSDGRYTTVYSTSTTYVPIEVRRDRYINVAVYFRTEPAAPSSDSRSHIHQNRRPAHAD